VALIAAILVFSFIAVSYNSKRISSLEALKYINDCSDAYTKMEEKSIELDLK